MPMTPMERAVAVSTTAHAISSAIPTTASTGVTDGKPSATQW